MSHTKHKFKGEEFPAKTRKKWKDKKDFGFTSGTHSHHKSTDEEPYPVKGKHFVKYGYGNGTKKENKVKNYKKEIE